MYPILMLLAYLPLQSYPQITPLTGKDNQNDLQPSHLNSIDIIQKYFKNRHCVTLIEFPAIDFNTDIFYQRISQPKTVHKIYNYVLGSTYEIRPRRDPVFPDGIIKGYCMEDFEGFIIFAPDIQTVQEYAFSSLVSPFLSPQSKIVIILSFEADFEEFFKKLWPIFRNPYIIIITADVFFYNPFIKSENKWGKMYNLTPETVQQTSNLIENDLNLHGYPFKAISFISLMAYKIYDNKTHADYGGVDGLILDALAEYMNFTKILLPNIRDAAFGQKYDNGTFDGALKYIITGEIDFVSVGYFLKDYLTRDIEFSAAPMEDDLCIVLHKPNQIPVWEILYAFYEVWLILLVIYFLMSIIWTVIQKWAVHFAKVPQTSFIFGDTLRLMIASSFPREPIIPSERIFLAFCMMAFVTFLGAFQGSLITIFSTPSYYPNIKTLEEFSKTSLPILTRFEGIKNDMFGDDDTNPVNAILRKRVKLNTQKIGTDKQIAMGAPIAGVLRRSSLDLENKTRYFDSSGANILYVIDECPRAYSLAYILPRRSAYAPRINQLILRASQSGFFTKWYADMKNNATMASRESRLIQIAAANQSQHKKFTVEDLIIGFFIVIIGNAISIVVFILEIWFAKILKCK